MQGLGSNDCRAKRDGSLTGRKAASFGAGHRQGEQAEPVGFPRL
jgi:hypothetical protein